jgi:hypothetical protein
VKVLRGKKLLKIPFHPQSLPTSCGAASLLMVAHFFKPEEFPLTREKELEIHQKIKYWEGDPNGEFGNVAKMIRFMRKNGFSVRYFLEISSDIFSSPPDFDKELWKRYVDSFFEVLNQEKEKGLEVIENCGIDMLLNEIYIGRPVICEINFSEYITHFVVVRGIKGNVIYFIDPLDKSGYQREHKNWFEKKLQLKLGKSFFSVFLEKNK